MAAVGQKPTATTYRSKTVGRERCIAAAKFFALEAPEIAVIPQELIWLTRGGTGSGLRPPSAQPVLGVRCDGLAAASARQAPV